MRHTHIFESPISNSDALNAVIVTILGISPFIPLYWTYGFLLFVVVVVKCVLCSSMPYATYGRICECTCELWMHTRLQVFCLSLLWIAHMEHNEKSLNTFNQILTLFKKLIHSAFVHQTEWGHRFLSFLSMLLLALFSLYQCKEKKKRMLNGVQFQSIEPSFKYFFCLRKAQNWSIHSIFDPLKLKRHRFSR